MAGPKNLGPGAASANELLRWSDINSIQNTAPTPQFDGDRWFNNDLGKEYVAIRNTGSVLVWIEVGGGATGSGETSFGTEAQRPIAGAFVGHNYYAQDTKRRFEWDGAGWICVLEPEKTYSVTLFGAGGNPNLGTTGSANGLWQRQMGRAKWRANITLNGTGITAGTGLYSISIPIAQEPIPGAFEIVGNGWYFNSAGFSQVTLDASPGSNKARLIATASTGAADNQVSATFPGAPAAGSVLSVSGEYQMDDRYA